MPVALTPDTIKARQQLIRQQYPTANPATLAKQMGISVRRLQTLASRLGVRRSAEAVASSRRAGARMPPQSAAVRALLAELARRPNGVSCREVVHALDAPSSTVWGAIASMQRAGQLHGATVSHRNVRYFASAPAAANFLQRLGVASRRTSGTQASGQTVVITRGPGPAHLPGEPQTTPHTKYTIAEPPKASLRSNTHLFSA